MPLGAPDDGGRTFLEQVGRNQQFHEVLLGSHREDAPLRRWA
jgi:hypothetical protein